MGGEKGISPILGLFNNRDKSQLGYRWLRDETLEESDSLPDTDVFAQEFVVHRLASLKTTQSQGSRPGRELRQRIENLETAPEQFREIAITRGTAPAYVGIALLFAILFPPTAIGRGLSPVCHGCHPDCGHDPDPGRDLGRPCLDPDHTCRSDWCPYRIHAVPTQDSHSMPTLHLPMPSRT